MTEEIVTQEYVFGCQGNDPTAMVLESNLLPRVVSQMDAYSSYPSNPQAIELTGFQGQGLPRTSTSWYFLGGAIKIDTFNGMDRKGKNGGRLVLSHQSSEGLARLINELSLPS